MYTITCTFVQSYVVFGTGNWLGINIDMVTLSNYTTVMPTNVIHTVHNTNITMQNKIHLYIVSWAPAGGWGGCMSRPSPSLENPHTFLAILGAFLLLSLHKGAFLLRFFHYGGPSSPCGVLFATFYFMVGVFFGLAPPSLRKFLPAPMHSMPTYQYAMRTYYLYII